MSKKRLSEKELLKGITPDNADEFATVSWDEMGLESSEGDYKAILKRIEALFDVAEPGTSEGDELEKLMTWIEAYEEEHFTFVGRQNLIGNVPFQAIRKL
ncbi:hypothetical protein OH460_16945 [Vibrio sp. Makdt]|uniref:hypothetical protein n=1 Tax=Vibrio sp. Makdt TaxID=2998828 RepID=UPI0022CDA739|nr:hypothetical protein [Vibrio sp. Makdt]MDA0154011.1 hypothetical protein [Vibrio sp. Makdt]